jgi:hypothetical protein
VFDKGKFQILLYICPGNIPFSFITHSWFVINNFGKLSRWEILFRKINHPPCWGHLYKDFFPTFQGIEIIPYAQLIFWKYRLLGVVGGELAKKLAQVIENSPKDYPYCNKFSLLGPTSNTYIQWVLDQFENLPFKLPWNAFGKGYKVRSTSK